MITLLKRTTGPTADQVEVILDIASKDDPKLSTDARALIKDASSSGRKVGCVIRKFGGDTYFTYESAARADLEVCLVSAMLTPQAQVHVTTSAGGEPWASL